MTRYFCDKCGNEMPPQPEGESYAGPSGFTAPVWEHVSTFKDCGETLQTRRAFKRLELCMSCTDKVRDLLS